jgi:hypothetical protein
MKRTSFKKGNKFAKNKAIGGRKKGSKNKVKEVIDLDEPTITKFRKVRGITGLRLEQLFREVLWLPRGEFEKKLKLAKEPKKYKSNSKDGKHKKGDDKPMSKAAKAMPTIEVSVYRYIDRLMKGGSADIDTTRISFIVDMVLGKCAPLIEQNKTMLERMKEFLEEIRIKGLDYDIGYADVVRFMFGTKGLTERELTILSKTGKELLEIELSRLELIPRRTVEKQFAIWQDWMRKTFGNQPKLLARFQQGCLTDFKEKLPQGDKVDFPLVRIDELEEENERRQREKVVKGKVVVTKKKKVKKKVIKKKGKK